MKKFMALPGFLLLSFAAALVGALFLPGEWYASLAKPAWNPPDWVFGPVWTVLYTLIGVSGWLAWQSRAAGHGGPAFWFFGAQLVLNAAWSWLFFGLHLPGLALVDILALWLAILATVAAFWRLSRVSALMLLPYLCWVGFAAMLNLALWRLNS
jgi:benzodiazapine receptor